MLDRLDFIRDIRINRRTAVVGIAFLAVLLLSAVLFLFIGSRRTPRVLFFPLAGSGKLVSEVRFLPNHRDLEADLQELVEGEILGPVNPDAALLFPRDATVRSLFVRGRVLYLDLSADVVLAGQDFPLRGTEALSVLKKAITFNFPRLKEVALREGGQEPRFIDRKKTR